MNDSKQIDTYITYENVLEHPHDMIQSEILWKIDTMDVLLQVEECGSKYEITECVPGDESDLDGCRTLATVDILIELR